ncbi:Ig-like domain-containing protein [Herbiconiux sp. A18JL235]|uniref:Ig-like domain-containing protein n=1 Tax=Herbiconiux sp. A18JL235 TaxID=3152363 RepID=A0AB39BKK9_9MICO
MSDSRSVWGRAPSRPSDGVAGRSRSRAKRPRAAVAAGLAGLALIGMTLVGTGLGASPAAATTAPTPSAAPSPETTPTPAPTAAPEPSRTPVTPTDPPGSTPPPTDPGGPGTPTPPPPSPVEATPPVIVAPAPGELLDGSVEALGEATPGATVQILLAGASEPFCIVEVPASGAWSCTIEGLESASSTTLRAVEIAEGSTAESGVQVRVLTAPVVTGGPRGPLTNAVVQGTAYPGATVTATTGAFDCTGTADSSGAWICPLDPAITDGPYSVTATQTTSWSEGASSPAGPAVDIEVDVTVPEAPVVLSPAAGARLPVSGALFSGTGENGATVTVFAAAEVLCDATVADSRWSCTGSPLAAGRYAVAVLQQDAAGNVSVQSGPLAVVFGAPSPSATPRPTPGATVPSAPSASGSPTTPPAPGTDDGATGAPSPSDGAPGADGNGDGGGSDAPDGTSPTQVSPGDGGSWADGTRFTTALQPVLGAGAWWWVALVVAALVLLLVALPARLLAGTVGALSAPLAEGSTRRRMLARLTGRNRTPVQEYDEAPRIALGRPARAALAVVASAALVTLSAPVFGEPAYLRLFLSAVLAVALLSAAATVVPALLARRLLGVSAHVAIEPRLLFVSAGFALVSRLADLDTALVFGLVASVALTAPVSRAARGIVAALQVGALLATGAGAWLLARAAGPAGVDAVGGPTGVVAAAGSELTTIVVLGAFGAASAVLLPFGGSVGRRIVDWSPLVWVALTLGSFAGLALAFAPALARGAQNGGLTVLVVTAIGFAVVSVSAWAWTRFVVPEAEDEEG